MQAQTASFFSTAAFQELRTNCENQDRYKGPSIIYILRVRREILISWDLAPPIMKLI